VAVCLLASVLACRTASGAEDEGKGVLSEVKVQWGGHLRAIGTAAWMEAAAPFPDDDPQYDGQFEGRLKNRIAFAKRWSIETHYELVTLGGDGYEASRRWDALSPALAGFLATGRMVDDQRRLLDLTHVLNEGNRHLTYHRIDRLSISHTADWGTLRLGRQALTWGDGLIFNPMDLFNPFAPTAVQRDYKVGDDMAHLQFPLAPGELQVLYLPRRDPATGDLEEEAASYAVKYHTFAGAFEMDVMAARHYADTVLGLGTSGYWGGAAWRINGVYSRLEDGDDRNGAFQAVANLDYAWVWGGKNYYGLLEFFYNSLGDTPNYKRVAADSDLLDRLSRGELFTIGRYYLSGRMQVELHPLVQFFTTAVVNLADPSGVLQPQLQWDVTEDLQAILGAQWCWGGRDTEFGGYEVAAGALEFTVAPSERVYLWLTYYF
jgi:hypothetical protein